MASSCYLCIFFYTTFARFTSVIDKRWTILSGVEHWRLQVLHRFDETPNHSSLVCESQIKIDNTYSTFNIFAKGWLTLQPQNATYIRMWLFFGILCFFKKSNSKEVLCRFLHHFCMDLTAYTSNRVLKKTTSNTYFIFIWHETH